MERKTIGGFIAALRKANGMTQRELAERLNVSDKTVSRWERDDGAPDLSAIPVLAEIFGVTCDELLRGERRPSEARTAPAEEVSTSKGEKQRQRLLAVTLSKYTTRSFIAAGVSLAGLIAAMVCNFGFLRAAIGCLIGAVFYLAGGVCQAVFVNGAFLAVSGDNLEAVETGPFKWAVIRIAERVFGLTCVLLGVSLPLMATDTYSGLTAESWLPLGALFGAAALALFCIVCWFLNSSLLKKGVFQLGEKEESVYRHNHRRKRRCTVGLAAALAVTLAVHVFSTEMLPQLLLEGITFHDYESFIEFMELDLEDTDTDYRYGTGGIAMETVEEAAPPAGVVRYYDQYGNVISEEEVLREQLTDSNGDVVCEYLRRNHTVATIRYSPKDGTVLPITVITTGEYREAWAKTDVLHVVFIFLYCAELAAALVIYFRKRAKL